MSINKTMKNEELNEFIKNEELKILDQELKLAEAKHEYDKAVFSELLILEQEWREQKNKELSTVAKRESIANTKPHIKQLKEQLDAIDITIRKQKIDLRFFLRQFKILTMETGEC